MPEDHSNTSNDDEMDRLWWQVWTVLAVLVQFSLASSKELHEILACCRDQPIKSNRTVVELGYLTAVMGDLHYR